MLLLIAVVLMSLSCAIAGEGSWSYSTESQNHWSQSHKACAGLQQSPINIKTTYWLNLKEIKWGKWKFSGWDDINGVSFLNGHNVNVMFKTTGKNLTMEGAGLNGQYCFAGLHFHWSKGLRRGSEHSVNGRKYPMEMHMVHYRCSIGSVSAAVESKDPEALAVLAFFLKPTHQHENAVEFVTSMLPHLEHSTSGGFFRYRGSLTTPPCSENVIWTVFEKPIRVPKHYMSIWHNLLQKVTHIPENDRQMQNPNGRRIQRIE